MNLALRPATAAALDAFRTRRSRLLWTRAFFCVLAVALGLLIVIALLDRAWFMPEAARPWVSLAAYVTAAVVAWRGALRFLNLADAQPGAAALVEAAEPALREKLLSAVELARPSDASQVPDSPEFRAKLQDDVAAQVVTVNLRKALPLRSVWPWTWRLGAGLLVVVLLSKVPTLHLPGFLARAALPFANLERPSSVKIRIVKPAPADAKAPIASEFPMAVEVDGPMPERVILEAAEDGARKRRIELTNTHGNHFEGMLPVGQADLRYRVLAGDGITPWHRLSARARPRVVEFAKVIVPPKYAEMAETARTEDNGDIEALEGSVVRLALKTNQPVSKAEMVLNPDQPEHPAAPQAKFSPPDQVRTEIEVTAKTNSWQIALTSEETGFTNDESSPWIITMIPDLPPVAQITEPVDQVELLPDEAVRLAGLVTDDIGLASARLAHAVNGANWQEKELLAKPGKEARVQHLFPLAPLGVKAGDAVLLKLVAVDLKGQRAESQPLRVIILEQTIDPRQRQFAQDQQRLAQQAANLAEKTREMRKAMEKVQKNARLEKKNKAAPGDPENALAKAQSELEQVKEQASDLWEELKKLATNATNQLDATETRLLGEKLAQMRQEAVRSLEELSREPVENPEQLRKVAALAANHAEVLANASRAFAAEDTAKIAERSARQLSRQENLLTESALQSNRDAAARPKWQEQQRAAIAATARAQEDAKSLEELVDNGGHRRNLEQARNQVAEAAKDLNESLDKADQNKSPEHLYGAADNLRQRLARTADAARAAMEDAASRAERARQSLMQGDNPALVALEEAKAAIHQAAEAAKNPKIKQRPTRDGLTSEQRAEKQLASAAKQLQDQAELGEQNEQTNNQQALDTNRASRAADKLARQVAEAARQGTPEALAQARADAEKLTEAARTLKADALAQTAVQALDEAANADPAAQKTDPGQQAAQAKAAEEQLKSLPQALRRVNAPNELAAAAQQAADAAKSAAENLKNAAKQAATQPPAQQQPVNQQPTTDAQMKAAQVAAQIAPKAEEARQALAALTPQLSEMMKYVSQDLKQTQQQTQTAANEAKAAKPVDDVAKKAQALQPEAAENAEKMSSLQAALRQEANAKNLAEADERQMARTADVALAQMQQKAPQNAQDLKQAAQATQSQPQAQSLQNAANAQQQTAQALDQLAQNFAKMEAGEQLSAQDLAATQQMEKDLNVQEPLDEAYQRAQELAQMAQDAKNDPAKVLQELEKELPRNPSMQKALAEIGKATAQATEQNVAQKANQPAMLGLTAELAAHDLARVARHQQRLNDTNSAQEVAKASNALQQTAAATKPDPSKATQHQAQEAQANASQAAKAAEQTASATPPAFSPNPFLQTQATLLAAALDKLDQTLHPMSSQQSQQGQPSDQGQMKEAAQQNLADAQQSQQQNMASQRNQGQVPGSQQPSQQMAQNQQQAPKSSSPQQSKEGGNFETTLQDGVLGKDVILVNGDWGHLPSRMAKDLTEATRQEAAPEYRAAIESYYKAIATKAKQ